MTSVQSQRLSENWRDWDSQKKKILLSRLRQIPTPSSIELRLNLRSPHSKQIGFIESTAKRKVIRAGRRGGKTVGIAIYAIKCFAKRSEERRVGKECRSRWS